MREVRRQSDQVDDNIRDVVSDADWDIQSSSSDVTEFADVVMSFIAMIEDTIVLTVRSRSSSR